MATAQPSFLTLARSGNLDQETAYCICQMIDSVGWALKEDWDWDWLDGKRKDYRRLIEPSILEPAWDLLFQKEWFSLQTTNDVDKKISTIEPLRGFIKLRSLVLQNNLIRDLRPLESMPRLRELLCYGNRISDLAPLANLPLLEELSLGKNPVKSFRVLEELPNLRDLSVSTEQAAVFSNCVRLPYLVSLRIEGDGLIGSLKDWPEMPALMVVNACGVKDLAGIERFASLRTIRFSGGKFSSLIPLQGLRRLTHVDISSSKALDVKAMAGLFGLRSLSMNCAKVSSLAGLSGLPVLHDINVTDKTTHDVAELGALQKQLTPWDAEFKADARTVSPSLDLQIVSQEKFDFHDDSVNHPFGIRSGECYDGMFTSERAWLVKEIDEALAVRFTEQDDFVLPYMNGLFRSDRLVLYSVAAYEAFRDIVLIVQRILCETKNDWIIYFQSLLREGPEADEVPDELEDFIVWIYPDRILATKENARIVRKLIDWKP